MVQCLIQGGTYLRLTIYKNRSFQETHAITHAHISQSPERACNKKYDNHYLGLATNALISKQRLLNFNNDISFKPNIRQN